MPVGMEEVLAEATHDPHPPLEGECQGAVVEINTVPPVVLAAVVEPPLMEPDSILVTLVFEFVFLVEM